MGARASTTVVPIRRHAPSSMRSTARAADLVLSREEIALIDETELNGVKCSVHSPVILSRVDGEGPRFLRGRRESQEILRRLRDSG
jgi:hypothetical protein